MELAKAEDVFTEARELLEGKRTDGTECEVDLDKSEKLLNEILNANPGNVTVLHVLASLHLLKGNYGLAQFLEAMVVKEVSKFGEAWNNLGMAFKHLNNLEDAVKCAKRAAELIDHANIPCNVSGLHLNRGMPEIALEWADKALAKDPEHLKAKWHKAMALLEIGEDWGEAWDLHEVRLTKDAANENITERNYHGDEKTPWWDGKAKGTVVIHGEQGMGDEILFATCMQDAIDTGADIIFEPSPRLEGLFKRSFPSVKTYGTNDVHGERWLEELGPPAFKAALGSLPKFYRRTAESFTDGAYLVPDPDKQTFWQGKLDALNAKPKIGLAWQGGVPSTRIDLRSFHPRHMAQLYRHDVQWVSLQYDTTALSNVMDIKREFGVNIEHWPKAVAARDPDTGEPSDLDELAALISCLDLVITVPQTCYHIAGALGVPTWVMTPSEPDWRLNTEGETNVWYDSVRLFRQPKETRDWPYVFNAVDTALEEFLNVDKRQLSQA